MVTGTENKRRDQTIKIITIAKKSLKIFKTNKFSTKSKYAMWMVILTATWKQVSYNFLFFLAA